jgi:hypothetical protein
LKISKIHGNPVDQRVYVSSTKIGKDGEIGSGRSHIVRIQAPKILPVKLKETNFELIVHCEGHQSNVQSFPP